MLGAPVDFSSAVRIAVLRATHMLQRWLICAAVGVPVRIGGIVAGAAIAADPSRLEPTNNNA
jgi:hypothetical protein